MKKFLQLVAILFELSASLLYGAQPAGAEEEPKYWLSVWVHEERTPQDDMVLGWFQSDSMKWVKSKTKFVVYDSSHPKYQTDEFQQAFPVLPAIALQERPSGEPVEIWQGDEIPWHQTGMNRRLSQLILKENMGWRKKRRQADEDCDDEESCPKPPLPKQEQIEADKKIVEEPPKEVTPEAEVPFQWVVAGCLVAVALVGAYVYRREMAKG